MNYEIDFEARCPSCGHHGIHFRDCMNCEDGYIEHFFDDVEIEGLGEVAACRECRGSGTEAWCPSCFANWSGNMGACMVEYQESRKGNQLKLF